MFFELLGMVFCYILFFFSLLYIFFYNSHYIHLLLLLELVLLSIFLLIGWMFMTLYGVLGLFVYLLIMVCMGGFSISMLVSLARFFGRDFWYNHFIF